jgi:hypothetical protein
LLNSVVFTMYTYLWIILTVVGTTQCDAIHSSPRYDYDVNLTEQYLNDALSELQNSFLINQSYFIYVASNSSKVP